MNEKQSVQKTWLEDLVPGEIRLRVSFTREGKVISSFTVQVELWYEERWVPVVRYDNAHGYCHRDQLYRDGSQEKTRVFYGTINDTVTRAIDDVKNCYNLYIARYLRDVR